MSSSVLQFIATVKPIMTTELATIDTTVLTPVAYKPDQAPALVYLAQLAPGSRRAMLNALATMAAMLKPGEYTKDERERLAVSFPWGALRRPHTQALRSQLAAHYSAATANKMLSALRGTLKEAWGLKLMTADDYQDAVNIKAVQGQKASQAEKGRALSAGELSAMLATCTDGTSAGLRDAALIAVGYTCGLRRAELAALLLDDFSADKGQIIVKHGKRNKERVIPIVNGALAALQDWLNVRGPWAGPLFTRVLKGDKVTIDGIVEQTVYDILARRAELAGVAKFSPHDLRRTFAGDLLDAGADIATVQKLMGHESVDTTANYDRRDAKTKRAAVNKLHIGWKRQTKD